MTTSTVAVVSALLALFILMSSGAPIAFALAGAGVVGLWLLRDVQLVSAVLAATPFDASGSFSLVVIPMFVLLGAFATRAGIAEDVFRVSQKLIGHLPGGLALATVAACAGFGAVSGSSNAMVASLAPAAVGEMRKHGYQASFAAGVVASAGTLAIMIPPSVTLVLYAIITEESIGACLTAGILPGLLSAAIYIITVLFIGKRYPSVVGRAAGALSSPRKAPPISARDFAALLKVLLLFSVVMGGIYGGLFTPTEAAALGAVVALIMLLVTGFPRWIDVGRQILASLAECVNVTSFIFVILIGASIFSYFLVAAGVPSAFAAWAVSLQAPPLLIVGVLLLAIIPMGMFLDPISIMLIVLPLAHPVVTQFGFSGVWFAVVVTQSIEIGLVTPPFGLNVFIVASASKVSAEDTYAGIMWFLPTQFVILLILFFVPVISTWLPGYMGT